MITAASMIQGLFMTLGFYANDDSRLEVCRRVQPPSGTNSGTCVYSNPVGILPFNSFYDDKLPTILNQIKCFQAERKTFVAFLRLKLTGRCKRKNNNFLYIIHISVTKRQSVFLYFCNYHIFPQILLYNATNRVRKSECLIPNSTFPPKFGPKFFKEVCFWKIWFPGHRISRGCSGFFRFCTGELLKN